MYCRCHTMDYAEPILINLRKEGLMFNLNKNLSYLVFLHDPDFFLVTINPVTMPSTDTTILFQEAGDAYMTLTLQVGLLPSVNNFAHFNLLASICLFSFPKLAVNVSLACSIWNPTLYCGFSSNWILLYFPTVRVFVRHRRDISHFSHI